MEPTCRVCEGRISWKRYDAGANTCKMCERAITEAAQEDRNNGIDYRCYECYEPNGFHVEGMYSQWRDVYE